MINVQPQATDVAIIGMSALFPGASDLKTYWQNIINRVSGIKDAPDAWVRNYFDPDSKENDRIYNKKGGFIGDIANPILPIFDEGNPLLIFCHVSPPSLLL